MKCGGLKRRPLNSGMTLIEVLVALVLISVGLLGVAALQLTTLKGNKEAYVRSQASALSGFILDRIRANRLGFENEEYFAIAFNGEGVAGTTAGDDLAEWQRQIDLLLPGGAENAAGSIQRVGTTNAIEITIQWSEREDEATFRGDADTLPTFRTRTEI